MNGVINVAHDDYKKLYQRYLSEKGTILSYQGKQYMVVRDNDEIKFVETVQQDNFDSQYGKQSFRNG